MDYGIGSDSESKENYELDNYKGIFYDNNCQEENFYEYGAHFSYVEICKKLEELRIENIKNLNAESQYIKFKKNQSKHKFK